MTHAHNFTCCASSPDHDSSTGWGRAPRVAHLASALIGCLVLHHFFAELAASFVAHAALSYAALFLTTRLLPVATAPLSLLVSLTFVFAR